ncbi:MAG: cytochrome c oxidase subunit 4 [Candidatus Latescibacterota bacterium]|mgnify:CR=1 FL=1|jgi:cytochrome c oxidase subunit 4
MADHEHNLTIFRGLVKFKSNITKIWGVFVFLSIVTIVEVALGIEKPDFLMTAFLSPFEGGFWATMGNILLSPLMFMKPLNLIFIVLTLVKAYYITWDFMHMRDETSGLRRSVVWTTIFLLCYLVLILLIEGDYIFETYKNGFIKFDF